MNKGGEKQNRGEDRGHRLIVSREEMEAAAAAFDEHTLGCTQNHDDMDNAWRAALTAAHEVRLRRLADEAERGFSPEQIGEPRSGRVTYEARELFGPGRWRTPCPDCGEVVDKSDDARHDCNPGHDHDVDRCTACHQIEQDAFADGQAYERHHSDSDRPSRHGPRHVGWDRVIEALSGAVDEAIIETVNELRALEDLS